MLENVKKCNGATHIKRVAFKYALTAWGATVMSRRGGEYSGCCCWCIMNKREWFFLLFIFVMHLPTILFLPTVRTVLRQLLLFFTKPKDKSLQLPPPYRYRTHVRDFFFFVLIYICHNEERFCACFKHPPLTRLSPRFRGPPPPPPWPHYVYYTYNIVEKKRGGTQFVRRIYCPRRQA